MVGNARRWMHAGACLLFLTITCATSAVRAAPYEFVATYKATTASATKELVLKNNDVIPDAAEGWYLAGVKLRVKKAVPDAISLLTMKRIRATVGDARDQTAQLWLPTQTETEIPQEWTHNPDLWAVPVNVELRIRLSTEFLCGEEILTRNLKGKPRCKDSKSEANGGCYPGIGTEEPQKGKGSAPGIPVLEGIFERDGQGRYMAPLTVLKSQGERGTEILFSFCETLTQPRKKSGERVTRNIDWDKLVEAVNSSDAQRKYELTFGKEVKTGSDLMEAHKAKLLEVMQPTLEEEVGIPGQPVLAPNPIEGGTEVAISDAFHFTVVRAGMLFQAVEINGENETPLPGIVDVESPIQIRAITGLDRQMQCERVFGAPFIFRFESTDDKGKPVQQKLPLEFGAACQRFAKASLKDYLDRAASISIYFPLDDTTEIRVWKSNDFTIRRLGLITTFPVVSEIVAAAKQTPLNDPTASSSIPISWAVRLGENTDVRYTAVTFPWKFSVNTRKYPQLSKYFAFYPHVSLITPVGHSDSSSAFLSLGAGISVAEAFHFSYAWTPSRPAGGSSNFFLVGLGIQDLVKLAQ